MKIVFSSVQDEVGEVTEENITEREAVKSRVHNLKMT